MNQLEIIFQLCDITCCLLDITKRQQVIIEQCELEKSVKSTLNKMIEAADEELGRIGHHVKRSKYSDECRKEK